MSFGARTVYRIQPNQIRLETCIDDERQFKKAKHPQAPMTPLFGNGFPR